VAGAYPGRHTSAGLAAAPETRQRQRVLASGSAYALDHVAIAVARVADTIPLVGGRLGGLPVGSGPGVGFRFWQWEFERGGRLEMLEPDGPPGGFLQRFLDARGPGVHHVTFKVPELEAAMARAEQHGYEIVGRSTEWPAWKEAFLHPRQAQGIVVQLAESHPELEPDDLPAHPFPELAGPRAESADLVGVRLAAANAERARHQWQALLGGSCSEVDDQLVFRWPGSPLRIAVTIDAGQREGALGLEVGARPDLPLDGAAHPLLGTSLLPVRRGQPVVE